LAASNLLDAYEKLFPSSKYKISSKKIKNGVDFQYCLKQTQENLK
jgi:hypothetical protein